MGAADLQRANRSCLEGGYNLQTLGQTVRAQYKNWQQSDGWATPGATISWSDVGISLIRY